MKTILFYIGLAIIIILSFFFYSSNFYTLVGSDDAVMILMLHDYHWLHDLYFWGQDRYGTLIPMLGQIFYRGFGFSALTSESITHYLLLIAGYFAFTTFFKSRFCKIILALALFFPPLRMIDVLRLNIGQEYLLLAISIYILKTLYETDIEKSRFKQNLLLLSVTFLFILTIWVSDLAIVSIFLILTIQFYFVMRYKNADARISYSQKPWIFYLIGGLFAGSGFILYAKYYANKSQSYSNFNDLITIIESTRTFGRSMSELLMFKAAEPFTSLYLYLVSLLTVLLFVFRKKIHFNENQKKWFIFFVLDLVLIFVIIMISKWSYLNGVPRRYFTGNYIMFWMAFLLAFEYLAESNIKKGLRVILLFTIIIAGAGSIYNLKYVWPKTLKPRVEYVREFESLGKIGIIGNYWNSYINSITNPDQIIATPNDHSTLPNPSMAADVLKRDTIYIIRDGWFEIFPDSLNQFGTPLYKNGEEFRMGDCFVCRYRK